MFWWFASFTQSGIGQVFVQTNPKNFKKRKENSVIVSHRFIFLFFKMPKANGNGLYMFCLFCFIFCGCSHISFHFIFLFFIHRDSFQKLFFSICLEKKNVDGSLLMFLEREMKWERGNTVLFMRLRRFFVIISSSSVCVYNWAPAHYYHHSEWMMVVVVWGIFFF